MGDPLSLFDFVNKTTQRYPAKHYAMNFLGHSWGWREVCFENYTIYDCLSMTELKQAFSMIKNDLGVTFDLLGFDTCFCAQLEVACQIKDYAQAMVGYEAQGGYEFFGYNVTLTHLADNPEMNATELAKRFVTNYKEYHLGWCTWFNQTISTVSLANITALSQCISSLATELQENLEEYRDGINASRNQTEEYGGFRNLDYVDVYHFAELLEQNINDGTIDSLCQQVKQVLNATIISEWHRNNGWPNSHGLSIYFPNEPDDYEGQYDYTEFCNCTQWDEFLKAYLGI